MDIIIIYDKNNVHYCLDVQQVIGKMEIDIAFKRLLFPTQFVLVSNCAGPLTSITCYRLFLVIIEYNKTFSIKKYLSTKI